MLKTIAFDADDTLWHNETIFHMTHEKFENLLADYQDAEWIKKKLFETEMRNLQYFGYGIKGFTLSMIETAIELTNGQIDGKRIQEIINFARAMVKAPVELLEHVHETIPLLAQSYTLMLITKGDIFDQESKIARSGLLPYFKHIDILSKKTPETYQAILQKYDIASGSFMMVGNSLKSDVLPVLALGGHGVFIPYPLCWEHEQVEESELHNKNYHQLEHIGQLPGCIQELSELLENG